MGEKTDRNLAYAFAAESKAAARNAVFADKAATEGYPQIARLFRAVSDAEGVHARKFLMLMRGKIGSTEDNLKNAFEHEIEANVKEYPKLIADAVAEGVGAAEWSFTQARNVEERHAALYKKALTDMIADRETIYHVCQVCGYVAENQAPDNCPICGAVKTKFKQID